MLKVVNHSKLIIVPSKFLNLFVTDFYINLIELIQDIIPDIVVIEAERFDPTHNIDIVFVISLAHWRSEDMTKIQKIPKRAKVIAWYDDVIWVSEIARKMNLYLFDRANCILSASKYCFLDLWGKFESKLAWFPFFASPYFHKTYGPKRPKCLLSGSCSEHYYPLRFYLKTKGSSVIDVLEHPGYQTQNNARSDYANILGSYFCCVTDGGRSYGACKYKINGDERVFDLPIDQYLVELMGDKLNDFTQRGQVVLKFFEIPAVGSLLIAPAIPELFELGYKDAENFICVTKDNVIDVIEDCCSNSNKYDSIRLNGLELAQNHTMVIRAQQLRSILEVFDVV